MKQLNSTLYNREGSWKIFGPPIEVGDRLHLEDIKLMPFSQMKEDDSGVFVFLPNIDHHYYDNQNIKRVRVIHWMIRKLMSFL